MQRPAKPLTPVRFRAQPPYVKANGVQDNSRGQPTSAYRQKFLFSLCPGGEIGRRKGLKIPREKSRAGSSPAPGTI